MTCVAWNIGQPGERLAEAERECLRAVLRRLGRFVYHRQGAPPIALPIDEHAAGNREDPAALVADGRPVSERAHHPQEDVLHQIVRDVAPAGHPDEVSVDVVVMSGEQVCGAGSHASSLTS